MTPEDARLIIIAKVSMRILPGMGMPGAAKLIGRLVTRLEELLK